MPNGPGNWSQVLIINVIEKCNPELVNVWHYNCWKIFPKCAKSDDCHGNFEKYFNFAKVIMLEACDS